MAMTAKQREANVRAHKSLAQTRLVAGYLDAVMDRQEYVEAIEAIDGALPELERGFIKAAKAYSIRKGYTRQDWIALGVSPQLLNKAGIIH